MSIINKMADAFVGHFINWRTLVSCQINSIHGAHHEHKYMVYNMSNEL